VKLPENVEGIMGGWLGKTEMLKQIETFILAIHRVDNGTSLPIHQV
jgi:hypothetical protein